MENVIYGFNPVKGSMVVFENGKVTGGCKGRVAWAVARMQVLNAPETIFFDLHLTQRNAEGRITAETQRREVK